MIAEDVLVTLRTTAEITQGRQANVSDIVQHAYTLIGHDFVLGFAERRDSEMFVISTIAGATGHTLQGIEFSIGEGFMGQVVATGRSGYWVKAYQDPRSHMFENHGVPLNSIACSPVRCRNQITGVLFALLPSPSEHAPTLVDLLAFLVGRQFLIQAQESSLDVWTLRFSALIELSQAIQHVEEPRNILYMVLDMAMNLEQGPTACLAFLPNLDAGTKLELLSRGMQRDIAADYGRDLLREYIGRSKSDVRRQDEPMVRKLNDTYVMEYPISFRDRVVACLSITVDSAESPEIVQLAYALSTVASIALHFMYTNHEDSFTQNLALIHKVTGYWAKDTQQHAERLQELSVKFSEWLNMSSDDVRDIAKVALLSVYDEPFILQSLRRLPDKVKLVLQGYHQIMEGNQRDNGPGSVGSEILAVANQYLVDGPSDLVNVDPGLKQKFQAFLTQYRTETQQISAYSSHELPALDIEALSTLPSHERLTVRELGVLQFLIKGHANREIAQILMISEHTVKNHLTNIFQKLGVGDRAQAIAYVLGNLS